MCRREQRTSQDRQRTTFASLPRILACCLMGLLASACSPSGGQEGELELSTVGRAVGTAITDAENTAIPTITPTPVPTVTPTAAPIATPTLISVPPEPTSTPALQAGTPQSPLESPEPTASAVETASAAQQANPTEECPTDSISQSDNQGTVGLSETCPDESPAIGEPLGEVDGGYGAADVADTSEPRWGYVECFDLIHNGGIGIGMEVGDGSDIFVVENPDGTDQGFGEVPSESLKSICADLPDGSNTRSVPSASIEESLAPRDEDGESGAAIAVPRPPCGENDSTCWEPPEWPPSDL